MTALLDHVAAANAKIDLAIAKMKPSAERLMAIRSARYRDEYVRVLELPFLLPHWKFLNDALHGRSSALAIIEALQAEHAKERNKARVTAHWTAHFSPDRANRLNGAILAELRGLAKAVS